jgi:sugar/nucleoside kinase (ribokinase family)
MPMSHFDVITIGDYFCDLVVTGLPGLPRLGIELYGEHMEITAGGVFINATALHRLGVKVGWVADFGNDLFSQYALQIIRKEGLDESLFRWHDFPVCRMTLSFSYQQDRGFITYVDPLESSYPFEEVRACRPRAVLFNTLPLEPACCEFIQTVHECGGIILMDPQYTQETLQNPVLAQSLGLIDIFSLNESEAAALTGKSTPEEALDVLAALCPLAVIKCGARGAIAQQGGQRVSMPGLKVQAVDTTGAGDCFNSGFLAARLRGLPLETCLQYGNICGGLSTTGYGGTAKAPTQAEVDAYLAVGAQQIAPTPVTNPEPAAPLRRPKSRRKP